MKGKREGGKEEGGWELEVNKDERRRDMLKERGRGKDGGMKVGGRERGTRKKR